jgi:hypothetical protein
MTFVTCLVTNPRGKVELMQTRRVFLALCLAILCPLFASGRENSTPKIDNEFVHREFGKEFTLIPEIGAMVGDLDGDGVNDVVIAARCKNPLLDQAEHNYTVIDPYYTFYGYGDPKLTTTFTEGDPTRRGLVVLIIHGAGANAWRSQKPKSKYVVINIPYRELSVRKFKWGKKTVEAVYTEEDNDLGESSALVFDGKKYRYVPMGANME